jgi:NitT/TauT family transport system substrate-binding protein
MSRSLFIVACLLPLTLLSACSKTEPKKEPEPAAAAPSVSSAPAAAATVDKEDKGKSGALKIGYSDWPGWVAWDIAVQKGWFKEAGVDVEFVWFDYGPSMEAYTAGSIDAVGMTNGDALVTGSSGKPSVAILLNDFSNGNDMIVAKKGITSLAQLKGKKIGVELKLVDHLLLLKALESVKLKESDVTLVNLPTNGTPEALKTGDVDAIGAWQPSSGAALREVPGSSAIYTSANAPGLIYDVLAVSPKSLSERRADWTKVVQVWFRVADFIKDPKNIDEAAKIMSARVGLKEDAYKKLMGGTAFQDLAGNIQHFKPGDGLDSVYGSNKVVNDFNLKYEVYKTTLKFEEYLDPSIVTELGKSKT